MGGGDNERKWMGGLEAAKDDKYSRNSDGWWDMEWNGCWVETRTSQINASSALVLPFTHLSLFLPTSHVDISTPSRSSHKLKRFYQDEIIQLTLKRFSSTCWNNFQSAPWNSCSWQNSPRKWGWKCCLAFCSLIHSPFLPRSRVYCMRWANSREINSLWQISFRSMPNSIIVFRANSFTIIIYFVYSF